MIPNDNAIILFKFGFLKWMDKIRNGTISFSCPGKYIQIAKKTGNDEQGDVNEGVFARLRKGDKIIKEMQAKLKDDLEIIDDGEYVKLRRWSSYYIPTFCFYSYRLADLLDSDITETGFQTIHHYFDDRMYSAFGTSSVRNVLSADSVPAYLILQVKPFIDNLMKNLAINAIGAEIKHINYTEFQKEEFFLYPTERREELFYKFPKYAYQKEARICLVRKPLNSIHERLNIDIDPMDGKDAFITKEEFYFGVTADIVEENEK
ncbi:hypothetical protein Q9251_09690 [Alkalihalobacillus macyae]|uniref:hypothetical protein n=1 Tax=Guptibacillus hwajinpoensis TaxID=208199 RepID=UPI00273C31B6|nr:hypothetical protein [Alkalihalobacillus macyae]MDP4551158.1 hypothetical protein [Alkalihalobacillus macyae]